MLHTNCINPSTNWAFPLLLSSFPEILSCARLSQVHKYVAQKELSNNLAFQPRKTDKLEALKVQ